MDFIQLKFKIYNLYRLYILKQHDCENCKYFGGLMCNHVDKNGKCLGWEKYKRHPICNLKYRIKLRKTIRKMKKYEKS